MKDLLSNLPAIVMLVGALLVALGTFVNVHRSARKSAEANAIQAGLYKQLAEKSNEIARLNVEIKNWVTGGDSTAVVTPTTVVEGRSDLYIVNSGAYPLLDVQVSIQDLAEFGRIVREQLPKLRSPHEARDVISGASRTYQLGAMPPNTSVQFPLILPIGSIEAHYNIQIQTLSGSGFHQLVYRKVGDRWLFALRSYSGSKIVSEQIPQELAGVFDLPAQEPNGPTQPPP